MPPRGASGISQHPFGVVGPADDDREFRGPGHLFPTPRAAAIAISVPRRKSHR